jgi:hypothetical protein
VSLHLYPFAGLSLDLYQFRTLPVSGEALYTRTLDVLRSSYAHFFVTQPFMGAWIKALLLVAVLGGFCALLYKVFVRKLGAWWTVWLVVGFCLMPVAAKSQFFVSAGESYYLFRFTSLGLNYVYLFFFLNLLDAHSVKMRNVGLLLGMFLLPAMLINCLHQQVLHVRSNTHDLAVLNRVIAKVEELPGFSQEKTWNLVQFGRTASYMSRTYSSSYSADGLSGFHGTISQVWHPGYAFWLIDSDLKLAERMNEHAQGRLDILRKAVSFAEGKKSFPAQGSVGIVDDTIVLVLDARAVENAKGRLAHGDAQ